MKLLVPVSYFFDTPCSEVWSLDVISGDKSLLFTLPNDHAVQSKGVTGLCHFINDTLLCCDFNSLYQVALDGAVLTQYIDQHNNDLHHVSFCGDQVYLANTGCDSVDVLDLELNIKTRYQAVNDSELQQRMAQTIVDDDYYLNSSKELPFYLRKVTDYWHFNHVVQLPERFGGKLLATSLSKRGLIDLKSMTMISNVLSTGPHDGVIWRDRLWLSSVDGKVYQADLSTGFPLVFEPIIDLFSQVPYQGWCRGLKFYGGKLFIAITAIYRHNRRTEWLKVPIEQTRTGIYQLCSRTWQFERFFDFTHVNGSRIFSFIAEASYG